MQQPRKAYEELIKYLRKRLTEVTNKYPDLKLEVNKGKLLASLNDESIQARLRNQFRWSVLSLSLLNLIHLLLASNSKFADTLHRAEDASSTSSFSKQSK